MQPDLMDGLDAVFCALPHGVSQTIVPDLLGKVGHVIDLGSDFRLKNPQAYLDWYDMKHICPEHLASSVYGLPELFRDEIKDASNRSHGMQRSRFYSFPRPFFKGEGDR